MVCDGEPFHALEDQWQKEESIFLQSPSTHVYLRRLKAASLYLTHPVKTWENELYEVSATPALFSKHKGLACHPRLL